MDEKDRPDRTWLRTMRTCRSTRALLVGRLSELSAGLLTGIYAPNGTGTMFFAVLTVTAQPGPGYIPEKMLKVNRLP
ncbi:hypothetical protein [Streptomyces sp. TLI_105]|uniref:hypothetical protein n=1 Tax=Streptomyces sp. TLI_105 TaxID=1881019 RepID=UPI00089A4E79|nr:hypothetical protein [Streptomyces sp. TLI_105]SEE21725.1 hypothetical protein SAMN05428939_7757 [Streptomyces sp. TLI_105]